MSRQFDEVIILKITLVLLRPQFQVTIDKNGHSFNITKDINISKHLGLSTDSIVKKYCV